MKALKALKRGLIQLKDLIYLSNFFAPIHSFYIDFIVVPKERLKRIVAYSKLVWGIGEWDYSWHLELFSNSLLRLHNTLLKDPYHTYSIKDQRRLLTLIECIKRFYNPDDYYFLPELEYLDKKYGPINYSSFLGPSRFNSKEHEKAYFNLIRSRTKNNKQKENYKLLCKLFKHLPKYWS